MQGLSSNSNPDQAARKQRFQNQFWYCTLLLLPPFPLLRQSFRTSNGCDRSQNSTKGQKDFHERQSNPATNTQFSFQSLVLMICALSFPPFLAVGLVNLAFTMVVAFNFPMPPKTRVVSNEHPTRHSNNKIIPFEFWYGIVPFYSPSILFTAAEQVV